MQNRSAQLRFLIMDYADTILFLARRMHQKVQTLPDRVSWMHSLGQCARRAIPGTTVAALTLRLHEPQTDLVMAKS